jgi:hypothetical protein
MTHREQRIQAFVAGAVVILAVVVAAVVVTGRPQ